MAESEWAIKVENVSKTFRVHTEKNSTLKEKLIYARRAKYREFVALRDVSLSISKGSTVGLLGVNGSGKSTLLKLISRILYPDAGSIQVRGKVSSLLELGAGFHPDFTGIENVFLNGSLMGLSKKEIQYKLDEIIDFSELGDFIREPIRSYSSGMYMRLAFSVAVAVDPEILLIDEILAVGDAAFQAKCMDRLKWLQNQNRTIVIVTHDTGAIERFCDRAVWLNHSKIAMDDEPSYCVPRYLQEAFQNANDGSSVMSFDRDEENVISYHEDKNSVLLENRVGTHEIYLDSIKVRSNFGENIVRAGESLVIEMNIRCPSPKKDVVFGISIESVDKILLYGTDTNVDLTGSRSLVAGEELVVKLNIHEVALAPGTYQINARVFTEYGEPLDLWPRCSQLTVFAESRESGFIMLKHDWQFDSEEVTDRNVQ